MNKIYIKAKNRTKAVVAALLSVSTSLPLGGLGWTFVSCSDMMDLEPTRVAYDDQHRIDNPNDSIYSVIGVLAQIQQVADRTLLMGELRGDLMTVDGNVAATDLQAINNLQLKATNQYAGARDFYTIINNCNYILAHMDTTITEGQTKVMVPEYAQVKTLRAWTYWQMGLIFGQVSYFSTPLTGTELEHLPNLPTIGFDELCANLADELRDLLGVRPLDYGTIDGWNSSELFYPTAMLYGDLCLYLNRYEEAAQAYYQLIHDRRLTVGQGYANYWNTATRQELTISHLQAYRNEVITRLAFDSDLRSQHSQLLKLTYDETPSLLPVGNFTEWMQKRVHFHTDNGQGISRYFSGDLRGCAEFATGKLRGDAFGPYTDPSTSIVTSMASGAPSVITKFYNNLNGAETDELRQRPLTTLAICRPATVYLRYAEAINRLGYPTTAFAVLKYGLSAATLNDTLRIDSTEMKRLPAYIDFRDSQFDGNIGTAARGCGLGIRWDRAQYVIPADVADPTDYVERAILDELAAETCFEGNRFFDLLCVSHHRADHPRLMAEQVSQKYADPQAMLQHLLSLSNWFVAE